jgi:hypothetical protein
VRGSISSDCSNPSVARIAIFFPFKFEAIVTPPAVFRTPIGRLNGGAGLPVRRVETGAGLARRGLIEH